MVRSEGQPPAEAPQAHLAAILTVEDTQAALASSDAELANAKMAYDLGAISVGEYNQKLALNAHDLPSHARSH
jgi:hypothetical protein